MVTYKAMESLLNFGKTLELAMCKFRDIRFPQMRIYLKDLTVLASGHLYQCFLL